MRKVILAAAVIGAFAIPAAPASAQYWDRGYRDSEVRDELRECRRELRRADTRREYRRERRECRRELREARRDDRREWRDDRRYSYRYRDDHYRRPYSGGYHGYGDRRYWDGYRWRYRW